MPAEEPLAGDVCVLSARWLVREDVMRKALRMAAAFRAETGREVWIISGYRTPAKQRALRQAGRPAADPDVSNHTSCPATAIDVSIGFAPTNVLKATLGRVGILAGLRWGGGSPVDRQTGIPSDWNHFDIGPRALVAPEGRA